MNRKDPEGRVKKAAEESALPENPDMRKIEELMVGIDRRAIEKG